MTHSTETHPASAKLATHTKKLPRTATLVLAILEKLSHGQLTVTLPNGDTRHYGAADASPKATLQVHDFALFSRVLRAGDIAFAECWMEGLCDTDNLPNLLKLFVANRRVIEQALYGSWWGGALDRILHFFRRNSKAQAKKNIAAHYDLGNSFYRLWLDPSMTYSAALYGTPYSTDIALDADHLTAAQHSKYQRVVSELNLPPTAKILEIGCGWGGFAAVAATQGHHVKGLTLSHEQLAWARQRMLDNQWDQQVNLALQDYRDEGINQTTAQYDGIASIEMFEAVGESYWPSYFACIARNLKQSGAACVQTIVIHDDLFERYRRGTDFIQRYIFPGGMLPSPSVFAAQAANAGLSVVNQHAFGLDYARTLAVWRMHFLAKLDEVKSQGYPQRFVRMWEFYLAYCEAGFVGGDIDVVQFTLRHAVKPQDKS